ncbi:MAG: RHS repeat-associated core domain-containing protein [Eubacteriaceae bacterium]|nr:RHS repeat-associated core domain-containing protein [Eubacteriaceae bacterium]
MVKSDGTLSAAYSYTDFGEPAELTGSGFNNEICYTGAMYDQSSGLYYMNARYYNPSDGRFISQDTYRGELDELEQWHLYAYCANNPINYTDPSGHDAIVLKSNFLTRMIGHIAVLIQVGKKWKYFSWDSQGSESKLNGGFIKKSVIGHRVNSMINDEFDRKGMSKKYRYYMYIRGDFSGSSKYVEDVISGRTYHIYDIWGTNCAWMALEVLKHGKISKEKKTAIHNMQWGYRKNNRTNKYELSVKTLVPSLVFEYLKKIFGGRAYKITEG